MVFLNRRNAFDFLIGDFAVFDFAVGGELFADPSTMIGVVLQNVMLVDLEDQLRFRHPDQLLDIRKRLLNLREQQYE